MFFQKHCKSMTLSMFTSDWRNELLPIRDRIKSANLKDLVRTKTENSLLEDPTESETCTEAYNAVEG